MHSALVEHAFSTLRGGFQGCFSQQSWSGRTAERSQEICLHDGRFELRFYLRLALQLAHWGINCVLVASLGDDHLGHEGNLLSLLLNVTPYLCHVSHCT